MDVTRMPVMPLSEKSGNAPFIDETEFTSPENEAEQVKIYIYLASPVFINEALQSDFGQHSNEQRDFVESLKSYMNQYDKAELQRQVTSNNGNLNLRLDGVNVTLVRGTHFFFNKKDQNSFSGN